MTPAGVLAALVSHAKATGQFIDVRDYEPKSAPSAQGVTLAIWAGPMSPVLGGLAATSARMEFTARLYRSMLAEPQSDRVILDALSTYVGRLTSDFTLGDSLRMVDLLGAYGDPLAYDMGYVEMDHKIFRLADIRVPLIINDVWTQAP